ncbi:MAG: prephenate dehydrogenase/arogenate dehydrogenase family protein [Candidatus Limnocylindrales bacterium]
MTGERPVRIAILGFGLIGGSIARAVRESADPPELVGWSPSNSGPVAAREAGVLDAVAPSCEAALAGADLIVIAAPPLETMELVERLGAQLRGTPAADAVVTDVASTKLRIIAAADEAGLRFVGGHPMAGREVAGFGASDARLFRDRPWVVVPGAATFADSAATDRVEWLAAACGARPIRMLAAEHDRAVASISHAPLIVAAALVEAMAGGVTDQPDWPAAAELAASGWRDMTRLARGDVRMGAGIAATNAGAIGDALTRVRDVLDAWIRDLEAGKPGAVAPSAALERRFRAARDRLLAASIGVPTLPDATE